MQLAGAVESLPVRVLASVSGSEGCPAVAGCPCGAGAADLVATTEWIAMTDLASSSPLSSFDSYRRRQALAAIAEELQRNSRPPALDLARVDGADLPAAVRVVRNLAVSADPSVVFGGLAQLLVPAVCDHAAADVHVGDNPALGRLSDPSVALSDAGVHPDGDGWVLTVQLPAHHGGNGNDGGSVPADYLAVLTCSWHGPAPTAQQVAVLELTAGYAALLVQQTRQSEQLQHHQRQVESLQMALDSNRTIGAAVGVLMATRRLTYPQAFNLLAITSQNTNTKLAALADTVVHTGCLPADL